MGTLTKLQTVKTQMKCSISAGSTLFVKVKKIFRQKIQYIVFFYNYNLTPLDMYTGLSQVDCIKPEGRIL